MAEIEFTIKELESEEWRDVVGYEGWYSVSNIGRVRREKRGPHTRPGRLLNPSINEKGYPQLGLWKRGKGETFCVHQLVARAFIGPVPEGMCVNHIDAKPGAVLMKLNNRVGNLEYTTPAGNGAHAAANGLMALGDRNWSHHHPENVQGERNVCSKLKTKDVLEIRSLIASGVSVSEVARRKMVSRRTVQRVRDRKAWCHID